jgi:HEPN/RES N-terminal domain 1
MGLAKRQMEEDEERGWSSVGEKWCCADHVEDDALGALIADEATSTVCSYCGREAEEPFAATVDLIIERFAESLPQEWGGADEETIPWEGGYVWKTLYTWDLVTDGLNWPLNNSDLIQDVVGALPEQAWVPLDRRGPTVEQPPQLLFDSLEEVRPALEEDHTRNWVVSVPFGEWFIAVPLVDAYWDSSMRRLLSNFIHAKSDNCRATWGETGRIVPFQDDDRDRPDEPLQTSKDPVPFLKLLIEADRDRGNAHKRDRHSPIFTGLRCVFSSDSVLRAFDLLVGSTRQEHPLFTKSTRLALRDVRAVGGLEGANFTKANRVELAARLIADIPSFPSLHVGISVRRGSSVIRPDRAPFQPLVVLPTDVVNAADRRPVSQ